MFNLNKKSKAEKDKDLKNEAKNILNPAGAADSGAVIHTMPKKFLNAHAVNNKAQKTGLIIIIFGIIFMIAIGFALYFFLFKTNNNFIGPSPAATSTDEAIQEPVADNHNLAENSPALSENINASSSAAALNEETATTTVYVDASDIATASTSEENVGADASTTVEVLTIGLDSDKDGLTDQEEMILSTSNEKIDSDVDGYDDRAELLNLYNPAGAGKLSINPNIKQYVNNTYGFNLLYPYSWNQANLDGDNSVVFKADNGHFFQVIIMPNNNNEHIEEWYKTQFWNGTEKYEIISLGDLRAVKSENGLMVYLTDKNQKNIFAFTYNLGLGKIMEYKNLFEVMIKSFEIKQ